MARLMPRLMPMTEAVDDVRGRRRCPSVSALVDSDPVNHGVIRGPFGECDDHLAAGVCGNGKGALDARVFAAGRGEDVEVGQDLRPVDAHVELALGGSRPIVFLEVERYRSA